MLKLIKVISEPKSNATTDSSEGIASFVARKSFEQNVLGQHDSNYQFQGDKVEDKNKNKNKKNPGKG